MKAPLASSIATLVSLEQPDPLGWHSFVQQQQQEGEAAAPAAADPGTGGGDTGGGGDPNADILSFEMPDPSAVAADIIKGKTPGEGGDPKATPAVKPPAVKPPEKKVEPATPPPKDEPIAQLRNSYETLKKEHAELKQRVEAGDPRLKALEAERDAAKKDLDEQRKRAETLEQQQALNNPAVVKELREADGKYQGDADKFYRAVPEISHATVSQLVNEYSKLPFNSPDYRAAREAFDVKVNRLLVGDGADENAVSRKLEKTLDWIESSHEYALERPRIEARVRTNARQLAHDHESKTYGEKKTHLSGLIQKAMNVPEGMDKSDPHHPQVVLKNFDSNLTPEQVASFDKGIAEFVELAVNGVPPRTETDYAGLTPQQIQERKATEAANVQAAKDHLVHVAVNGLKALRRIPTLYALLAKYKEIAGKRVDGDPPEGGGTGDNPDAGDLTKIEFPKIPDDLR